MKSIQPPATHFPANLPPPEKTPPKGIASPFPAGPRPPDVQAMLLGCRDHELGVFPAPRQALALILPPAPPLTHGGHDDDTRQGTHMMLLIHFAK